MFISRRKNDCMFYLVIIFVEEINFEVNILTFCYIDWLFKKKKIC